MTPRRRCTTTSISLVAHPKSVARILRTFKRKAWTRTARRRQFQMMTPSLDGPRSCLTFHPNPSLSCEGLMNAMLFSYFLEFGSVGLDQQGHQPHFLFSVMRLRMIFARIVW